MSAPQQKSRQREEHRDRQIEATEQPTVDPTGVPGLKCDVGHDDADGRACPHSFHGGQEITSSPHLLGVTIVSAGHDDSLPATAYPTNGHTPFAHGYRRKGT
jgi:hypothetical protein